MIKQGKKGCEKIAYEVPQKEFRKFLCRAAAAAEDSLPPYFPSVEEVDLLVDDPAFASSDSFKKDILFYFAASMIYGFYRDSQWHDENPGCREPLYPNYAKYLFVPCKGEGCLEPHIGIWEENTSQWEKEDRQSAFEYIQGILLDGEVFHFSSQEGMEG